MYVLPPAGGTQQALVRRGDTRWRNRLIFTVMLACATLYVPYFVYTSLMAVLDKDSQKWFVYHPVLMTSAAIAIPLPAILQRRLFGYYSNKAHMYCMLTAISCAAMGAYVIISHKKSSGEGHFRTWHSWFGLAFLSTALLLATPGLLALDPDWRMNWFRPDQGVENLKRFIYVRRLHTWTGRVEVLLGYLAVYLGWIKFFGPNSDMGKWGTMVATLIMFGVFILVDPVMDYFGYRKGIIRNELQQIRGG
jgi:hypothetical protein